MSDVTIPADVAKEFAKLLRTDDLSKYERLALADLLDPSKVTSAHTVDSPSRQGSQSSDDPHGPNGSDQHHGRTGVGPMTDYPSTPEPDISAPLPSRYGTPHCPECGYRCGCCCYCECQTPCPQPDEDGDCACEYPRCHGGHDPWDCLSFGTRYRWAKEKEQRLLLEADPDRCLATWDRKRCIQPAGHDVSAGRGVEKHTYEDSPMTDPARITIYDFHYAGNEWRAVCPICSCLVPSDKRQAHLDYHAWETSR